MKRLGERIKRKRESLHLQLNELAKKVAELKEAGIKEKNIVRKNILRVKKIKIGDKEYNPAEQYDRKNIVEGNIEDADEFTLGDGH